MLSEVKGTGKTDCAYPKERNILAGINIWSFSEKTEKLTVRVRAAATVDVRVRPVPWDQEDAPEQQDRRVLRDYRESRDQRVQLDRQEQLEPPDCRDHREFRVRPEPREQQGRRESRDQLV